MRTDKEILTDLIEAVRYYDSLRDDEWSIEEENNYNREMWDGDSIARHDEILSDIETARKRVNDLFFEATGDKTITL